jgi:hypothetical protein
MAHLHGDRAFGHGGGTSNQNLIADRDSADSSSSTEVRLLKRPCSTALRGGSFAVAVAMAAAPRHLCARAEHSLA